MGVDRPDRTYGMSVLQKKNAESHGPYTNTHLICDAVDEENPMNQVIQPSRQNLESIGKTLENFQFWNPKVMEVDGSDGFFRISMCFFFVNFFRFNFAANFQGVCV